MGDRKLDRVDHEEPTTPLGHLANAMFSVEGAEDIMAIVMLRDPNSDEYMTATHNYPHQTDALVDLLIHTQAVSAAGGLRMDLLTMDADGATKLEGFDPEEDA